MSARTVDQPRQWPPDPNSAEEQRKRARAKATIEKLFGPSDDVAQFDVAVIWAQAAAMEWVCDQLGTRSLPRSIRDRLQEVATQLRSIVDDGYTAEAARVNPNEILGQAARDALAEYRRSGAPDEGNFRVLLL